MKFSAKIKILGSVAASSAVLVLGCGNDPGGAPTPGEQTGVCQSTLDASGNLLYLAQKANNYAFSSKLAVTSVAVKPNSELTIDWSGLNADFQKRSLAIATDINMVLVVVWHISLDEMQRKLNDNELGAQDNDAAIAYYTTAGSSVTKASLFDFKVAGGGELPRDELMARLDPTKIDQSTHAYTVMPSTGTYPGQGVRMVQAFKLDASSTNQTVAVNNGSSSLTWNVDLTSLTPVWIPAGKANVTVDWSMMTVNGLGREFTERSVNRVMVAQYSESVAELKTKFLDIEGIAKRMYRGDVEVGNSLTLTSLKDANMQPFPGIDGTGTWILALTCGTCANPAPWFLTILKTCAATP